MRFVALLSQMILFGTCASSCEAPQPTASQSTNKTEKSNQYSYTGALDADCSHSGRNQNGVEVFMSMCPRTSTSPDGKWRLVNRGNRQKFEHSDVIPDYVFIEDSSGKSIGPVPNLSNEMPYAAMWSPRSSRFFVDHHSGSFMQQVRVFEITPAGVVEHTDFRETAQDAYQRMFPCLDNPNWHWVNGNVQGWSSDGRRLAWIMMTRNDICMVNGQSGSILPHQVVRPVLLLSDLDTGEVVEGSEVIIADEGFTLPTDGIYEDISWLANSAEQQ